MSQGRREGGWGEEGGGGREGGREGGTKGRKGRMREQGGEGSRRMERGDWFGESSLVIAKPLSNSTYR